MSSQIHLEVEQVFSGISVFSSYLRDNWCRQQFVFPCIELYCCWRMPEWIAVHKSFLWDRDKTKHLQTSRMYTISHAKKSSQLPGIKLYQQLKKSWQSDNRRMHFQINMSKQASPATCTVSFRYLKREFNATWALPFIKFIYLLIKQFL
jgi:hypothetical protein